MNSAELIRELEAAGVSDPVSEAEIILGELFGAMRSDMLLYREREYDSERIMPIIEKRRTGVPIQYIIGKWYFMGEEFKVSPDCLIPRPDTEILVYEALKLLKSGGSVADLCTGSGCIGLSLLKKRSDIKSMELVDISDAALDMARLNAESLGVYARCKFTLSDITDTFPSGKYDMIVTNPPYIPTKDIDALSDEVKKEPIIALDGGADGLSIIKEIIEKSHTSLNENGYLLVEFGFDEADKIRKIMDAQIACGTYKEYSILKDYGGNDRVLTVKK